MVPFPRTVFIWSLVSSVAVGYVKSHVLVRAPSPITATASKEPLSLECSYQVTGSDLVLGVDWYRRRVGENFKLIAQIPDQRVLNVPRKFTDEHLASKGKIHVLTMGIVTLVRLEINPAECTDEGEYECDVQVYHEESPNKVKVQVHLNEVPSEPLLTSSAVVVMDNQPVTFSCSASVGRPVGTFRWLVQRGEIRSSLQEVGLTGVTSFSKVPGRCSPIGTSTLAIMVTSADRKVTCVIEQQGEKGVIQVSDHLELDVKYRVRDAVIYTEVNEFHQAITTDIVVKKDDDVCFACRALGNPTPKFLWSFLPLGGQRGSSGLVRLSTGPELVLRGASVNKSGSYICVATNVIQNKEYKEIRSVRILIKDEIDGSRNIYGDIQQKGSISDVGRYLLIGGVVTGALLFTVFVSLLSVMCVRRCSKKVLDNHIRYTGVNA